MKKDIFKNKLLEIKDGLLMKLKAKLEVNIELSGRESF